MDKKQEFSNRLNLALDAIGFAPKGKGRQVQLAKALGVSQKGAAKWLEGETIPSMEHLAELAKLCRVYSEWLLTARGSMRFQEPSRQLSQETEQWALRMECLPPGERQKIFRVTEVMSAQVPPEKAA